MALISVIVPVFNEEECLRPLFERLSALPRQTDQYEFIFVEDGSTDRTREIVLELAAANPNVRYIFFSRNFGHEAATTAGLDHATGDAVVLIDADLQDPPEIIPQLIDKWRQGYQIVYAQRKVRKGESVGKRFTSWLFYRLMQKLSDVPIPRDTGDFRLMDRCAVESFRRCRERNRFIRGLVSWTGYRQAAVEYDRDKRHGGATKYHFFKLLHLALDALTGFSSSPLRAGLTFGFAVAAISFVIAAVVVIQKVVWGIQITGYAMLASGLFFLGGVQMFMIGLIGEYVGRIFRQVQERPIYVIDKKSQALPAGDEGLHTSHD